MLEVHHHPLCPFSRKLRIILKENKIDFELFHEDFWRPQKSFLRMNPAGSTPVVLIKDKKPLSGNFAITEYFEETTNFNKLQFDSPEERAEKRRLLEWFDVKFYNEVTRYVLYEKIIKTISRVGSPNSQALQAAKQNVLYHLDYIAFLTKEHRYLIGEEPSVVDYAAAAHLSVLDFVGDVPWTHNQKAKEWYALIKSRPSFKPLLMDRVSSINSPTYYSNPDF